MPANDLSEERRKEIFLALVRIQDDSMAVAQSRRAVAEHFSISEEVVKKIEEEGIDKDWPPL